MARFDGPAAGSSLNKVGFQINASLIPNTFSYDLSFQKKTSKKKPSHRDDIAEAAADYESESGSDSEAEPDHISSAPRNARGVDVKLVILFLSNFN